MSQVIVNVSFKLNDENLLDDWKKLSAIINLDLASVDGFLSRDSAIGDDGSVYCLVKWDSLEKQEMFMKSFEEQENHQEMMAEFGRLANMETMQRELLEVV